MASTTTTTKPIFSTPLTPDGYANDGTPLFRKAKGNPYIFNNARGRPSILQRYRSAANILSQCSHAHIIQMKRFQDSDTEAGIQLELELAPYGSIQMFGTTGQGRKSTLPYRLEHLIQVVDALDYLHTDLHVVHTNLNPSHFLVFQREEEKSENPCGLVKLGGFGGAFKVGDIGKPLPQLEYCPPESCSDVEVFPEAYTSFTTIEVLPSYDIYSMGRIILRQLLNIDPERHIRTMAGKVTEEEYRVALLEHKRKIRDGSLVQEAVAGLPGWWKDLVLSCCDIEPAKRISARQLKDKLIQEGRQEVLSSNVVVAPSRPESNSE